MSLIPAGHEEAFRRIFAQEAEQRLAGLSQHLLALEEAPGDGDLIASVFRDAHNLKGAAAVVGIADVSRVAHAMEDVLETLRSGARQATPEVIDVLLDATDGLTAMVPDLLEGHDRTGEAATLEERLRSVGDSPVPAQPADRAAPEPRPVPVRRAPWFADADDDTLMVPVSRLDELVRLVGESASANLRLGGVMTERWSVDPGTVSEFRALSRALNDLQERTMRARMVPVSTITEGLHRAVRDAARSAGKRVRWEVRGGDTELDRSVLQRLADSLLHLVRNAVDHGVEAPADRMAAGKPQQSTLVLQAAQLGSEVIIDVSDDGRGIDVRAVREKAAQTGIDVSALDEEEALHLVFRSGFSTARAVSDLSGRGVGLDVVRAGVEAVRGRIEVHSSPGQGTSFRLVVPITLAVLPCLLVEAGGDRYALPMHSVDLSQSAPAAVSASAGGRPMMWVGDAPLPVSSLARTLWGDDRPGGGDVVVVVGVGGGRRHAFLVDGLIGQRDVVVKGLSPLLPRFDVLAGASVEPDGSILLVLDVAGLVERARAGGEVVAGEDVTAAAAGGSPSPPSVLVVDDAAIVRQLERSILERAGYLVRTANDGVEALARLAEAPADLVITDIEMPRMDGFALTEAVRANRRTANTPVLIITARASEESRQRGLDVGADGYVVKSDFDENALLGAVARILGRPR
jgi:two-component system chemotaxis sensor kinase CheA